MFAVNHTFMCVPALTAAGTRAPVTTGGPTPAAGTQTPMHTTCIQNRASCPGKQLEMEFNPKTGQTVLMGHRAWMDQRTDQPALYMQPVLCMLLSLCFPMFVPSQIT